MDSNALKGIGFTSSMNDQILNLAKSASQANLDGIVCSARDIRNIRDFLPENFLYVTPGIRLYNKDKDDQKRVSTPLEAIKMGSDVIVIGRSITEAEHPEAVLNQIYDEIT